MKEKEKRPALDFLKEEFPNLFRDIVESNRATIPSVVNLMNCYYNSGIKPNGSYYIKCDSCGEFIHQKQSKKHSNTCSK